MLCPQAIHGGCRDRRPRRRGPPPGHQSQHGPQLLSEFKDEIHRGEHGVSCAPEVPHDVQSTLERCFGVLMPGDVVKRPNEEVIRLRRAKSRGFLTTSIPLEEMLRSNLRPIPIGVPLTDQRWVLRILRKPPRPSLLLQAKWVWLQTSIPCVSTPQGDNILSSWAHASAETRAGTGGT